MTKSPSWSTCRLRSDDRGVSTSLGYALTLAITAVLITGLLIAGGTLVEDQRERIAEEELSVTAEQLASGFGDADRLASASPDSVLRVTVWLPDRIAGGQYTITTVNHSTAAGQPARVTIVADAQAVDVTTELSLRTSVPVANRTVVGGPLVISHLDADSDGDRELVINESSEVAPDLAALAVVLDTEGTVDSGMGELSSVVLDTAVTSGDRVRAPADWIGGNA